MFLLKTILKCSVLKMKRNLWFQKNLSEHYIWILYLKNLGFGPTTTEFRPDALTDWAIRPWVQLTLWTKFVQLLQFHRLFSADLISAIAFVSRHAYIGLVLMKKYILINHVTLYQTIMAFSIVQWLKLKKIKLKS